MWRRDRDGRLPCDVEDAPECDWAFAEYPDISERKTNLPYVINPLDNVRYVTRRALERGMDKVADILYAVIQPIPETTEGWNDPSRRLISHSSWFNRPTHADDPWIWDDRDLPF